MAKGKAIIVGLSGCSSSGKTTIARLLRDIFPNTFILHEDDFYKSEEQLPSVDGLLDWDCAEALDIPSMADSLSYIRENASFPPTLDSKEDQNSIGPCPVPLSSIDSLKSKVSATLSASHPLHDSLRMCLLDGFLLYSPSMAPIKPLLDVKLFFRTTYAKAKQRREARDGYVTLEGFWKDPPGYVDKIVWPNYVREHTWMFHTGDVEGDYQSDALNKEAISTLPGNDLEADMTARLEWATDLILAQLKERK